MEVLRAAQALGQVPITTVGTQNGSARDAKPRADDPPWEWTRPMPERAVPTRSTALPVPCATSDGGTETRKDRAAVLGMPAVRHGGELRSNEAMGRGRRAQELAQGVRIGVTKTRKADRERATAKRVHGQTGKIRSIKYASHI